VTKLGQPEVREAIGPASLDSPLAIGANGVGPGLALEATSIEVARRIVWIFMTLPLSARPCVPNETPVWRTMAPVGPDTR
jgi:hypothetical protein